MPTILIFILNLRLVNKTDKLASVSKDYVYYGSAYLFLFFVAHI